MKFKEIALVLLALVCLFLSPALSLFLGIVFALFCGAVMKKHTSKGSSFLLKVAVVGLGFGINIEDSLRASSEGIVLTIVSIAMVMIAGYLLTKTFKIGSKLAYLISAGTAICGGSAIAAVAPVIKAKAHDTSMALAVIFSLNAIAMLIFPYIGHYLNLSQADFGMWAALAIHDTSAVVGAGKSYGAEALDIAVLVKLSRALWIIPLSILSIFLFKSSQGEGKSSISIPWFILLFVVAMLIASYTPLPQLFTDTVEIASHHILSLCLFLIGSQLSLDAIKSAGFKAVFFGISLWVFISVGSLLVIKFC